MRCRASSGLLTLAFLAATGCQTDTPLQLEGRPVEVDFTAVLDSSDAVVVRHDVWDLFEDSDRDAIPDDVTGDGVPDVTLWCKEISRAGTTVPWSYSLSIKRLRAGHTVAESLTSPAAKTSGPNLTPYDTSPVLAGGSTLAAVTLNLPRGRCSLKKALKCNPDGTALTAGAACDTFGPCVKVCNDNSTCTNDAQCATGTCGAPETRTFVFDNATSRRAFASNEMFSGVAGRNSLSDVCNVGTCPGVDFLPGICPSHNLGPARIDGSPPPFEVFLDAGDTIIVEARRFDTPPQASGLAWDAQTQKLVAINPLFALPPGTVPNSKLPLLRATLTVDGTPLVANQVQGNTLIPSGNSNSAIFFQYRVD